MASVSCAALARGGVSSALQDSLTCKEKQVATSASYSAGSSPSTPATSSSSSFFTSPSSSFSSTLASAPSSRSPSSALETARSCLNSSPKAAFSKSLQLCWPCLSLSRGNRRLPMVSDRRRRSSAIRTSAIYATQAPPTQQSMAESDVMGLLLRERIVVLGHQIDDFVADAVISQLLLLDAQDPRRDIRFFINCPGGSINATMGIFDAMQWCRADVSTIAMGIAASTASLVLMGGTKGKRFAMPNTRIMLHQPLGGASGQVIDVEIQAKEIQYHKTNFVRLISEVTGRAPDQVESDIDRDRYMSPMEAVEYGLIDGVIDKDIMVPIPSLPENVAPRPEYIQEYDRSLLYPKLRDDELF